MASLVPVLALLAFQGPPASMPSSAPAAKLVAPAKPAPAQGPARPPGIPPLPPIPTLADGVAAIVNDDVITISELRSRVQALEQTSEIRDPQTLEQVRRTELRQMVLEKLFTQAARARGIDESRVTAIVKSEIEELEKKAGGKQQLEANIRNQGKSYAEFEREKRSEIMSILLKRAELGLEQRPETDIAFSPAELRAYYREHAAEFEVPASAKGRQILLSDAKYGSREKTLEKAKELRAKIAAGTDFNELAREFSELKGADAGDLGWIRKGEGPEPKVEQFLFGNEVGAVSAPIELDGAVAIVKVDAKQPAGIEHFTDTTVQKRISDKMTNERRSQVLRELNLRLIGEAYIWPKDLFTRW